MNAWSAEANLVRRRSVREACAAIANNVSRRVSRASYLTIAGILTSYEWVFAARSADLYGKIKCEALHTPPR